MNNCESVSRESINNELIDSKLIDSKLIDSELIDSELIDSELIDSELIDSELIDSELINSELMNDKSDNNNPDIILSSENDKKNLNSKLIENCIKVKILKQNITENANPKKRGRKPKEKTAEDLKPKVLKKRGRKPKEKTAEELIPREPRKRGRKPKEKTADDLLPKIPKKRGRKPKDKYGAFSNNNISENKVEINNIILHLPIHSKNIETNQFAENQFLEYCPIITNPKPFIPNNNNNSNHSPYPFNVNSIKNTSIINSNSDCNISNDINRDNDYNISEDIVNGCPLNDGILNDGILNDGILNDAIVNEGILNDGILNNIIINENILKNKNMDEANINDADISDIDTENLNKNLENNIYIKYNDSTINYDLILSNIKKNRENKFSNSNNIHKMNNSNIMTDFEKFNLDGTWPEDTNIFCYWDCHPITNSSPCVLPISKDSNSYKVYGCFCSPECAAAYNFSENDLSSEIWYRYSLLNLLYKEIYNDNVKIKLAAPRYALKIFGGSYNINEFRELNSNYNRQVHLNIPPMISVIHQIEETNLENSCSKNKYIPLDEVRVKNADDNLRLKRKNPIVSTQKYTLENCMRLKRI